MWRHFLWPSLGWFTCLPRGSVCYRIYAWVFNSIIHICLHTRRQLHQVCTSHALLSLSLAVHTHSRAYHTSVAMEVFSNATTLGVICFIEFMVEPHLDSFILTSISCPNIFLHVSSGFVQSPSLHPSNQFYN